MGRSDSHCDLPKESMYRYVLKIAKKHAADTVNGPWITDVSTGKQLLSSDVEDSSRKVANFLTEQGFRPQDVVLYNTTRFESFLLFIGIWRLNGVIRASYPGESAETLTEMLQECKCRFAICDKKTAATVLAASRKIGWPMQIICFDPVEGCAHFYEIMKGDGKDAPERSNVDVDNDLCGIFTTGGTTGKSKGAMWTHSRFAGSITISRWVLPVPEKSTILAAGSISHIGGLGFLMYALHNGNHFVVASDSTTEDLIKGIREHKPSAITGFPPSIAAIASHPSANSAFFDSVVTIGTLGCAIADAHKLALKGIMKNLAVFHNLYGATETTGMITTVDASVTGLKPGECFPTHKGIKEAGCLGRPLPNVQVKVIDPDTGKDVNVNQQGEIAVKSPYIMKGYYNNPKETAASFIDGWYRTGDLGFEDENGLLYYTSRIKDTFKYFGNHVSSAHLEEVILEIPDITSASVIGIVDPDNLGSEIPRAFLVKKTGSAITAEEVTNYVHARVPDYQKLRGGVAFVKELPRTRAGKVSRIQIQQMYKNGEI